MPLLTVYKIVVRDPTTTQVIQIHEIYRSNVGRVVQELIEEAEKADVTYSFTVAPLR